MTKIARGRYPTPRDVPLQCAAAAYHPNTAKVQVCFRLLIRFFTTTTSFQQTVTTLSLHNQISTPATTSLQHLKSLLPSNTIIFCYFTSKFCEKPVSVINKLQPLSYQSTSNITPRLRLHSSQPPLKYTTLLDYSHILNTHKKGHTRPAHRIPNIRSHSALFS